MIEVVFPPDIKSSEYYLLCVSEITETDLELQGRLNEISNDVDAAWKLFDLRVTPKQFHMFEALLPPVRKRRPRRKKVENPEGEPMVEPVVEPVIVAGAASKADFVRLYERYMLLGNKEPRLVYDLLRAASHNVCALCGIIKATSLDHYLPKARYPIFSINPKNLVPACTPCNTIKGDPIYHSESDLHLYPYNDDAKFYNTDWIDASITVVDDMLSFDFFPNPPEHWSEIEKDRVRTHFRTFELHDKYKNNSMQLITSIMFNIRRILVGGDYLEVSAYFLDNMKVVPCNSTFRIMYKAVANDIDICSGNF
ncbi:hypothetical protein Q9R34_19335 [Enterobacter sp. BRE11]|nr:hypothetical protein [Enterobacter sp. BRE11]